MPFVARRTCNFYVEKKKKWVVEETKIVKCTFFGAGAP